MDFNFGLDDNAVGLGEEIVDDEQQGVSDVPDSADFSDFDDDEDTLFGEGDTDDFTDSVDAENFGDEEDEGRGDKPQAGADEVTAEMLESGDITSSLFDIDKKNVTMYYADIRLEYIMPNEFKKSSRVKGLIGLDSIVQQWGVVNPVHVLKLEDDDAYLLLDGFRRVYSAVKCGFEEVKCVVWDFKDKRKGKKLSRIISLVLNRHEPYKASELWNLMKILEDVDELHPGMIEFLTQMSVGDAMKLKEVMTCEVDYCEIREKLVADEIDISTAYKKLCNERKKENRLNRENNTSVSDEGVIDGGATDDARRLSDEEAAEVLDLDAKTLASGNLTEEEMKDLLGEAQSTDEPEGEMSDLNMTDEIRKDTMYQTTDERHPVDTAVKQATLIRDKFHCRCCGKGGAPWLGVLIYHHVIPVYAGGPDTVDNGVTLCQDCHMTLHNYITGHLQLDESTLTDADKLIFKNIFKFGNVALKASKKKKISAKQMSELDKTAKQHAYPDQYIRENTRMFQTAQQNGTLKANDTNTPANSGDSESA